MVKKPYFQPQIVIKCCDKSRFWTQALIKQRHKQDKEFSKLQIVKERLPNAHCIC